MFVKVCGLRTERDVDTAVEAGADAVGFVFAESPRRVEAATALRLARRVPEHVLTVGVFRDQPVSQVRSLTEAAGLRAIQLHGHEGPEHYRALAAAGRTLIRGTAYREPVPRCGELGEDILLLDSAVPGSGTTWEWDGERPLPAGERWLLAGGLTPHNVQDAIRATRPWGVDVSSGVEHSRGVKDPELIVSFLKAVRAVD